MKNRILILFCLMLAGCCFAPSNKFYVLSESLHEPIVSKKIKIGVYDILLPEYLNRPQIILQKPQSYEVAVAEYNRWAGDLSDMLKNALINNLRQAMPNSEVLPVAFGVAPQYVIKIEIEKFSGWLNDKALLNVNWQILNSKGETVVYQNSDYCENVEKTYNSYVMAHSKMWANFALDISGKFKTLEH